MRRATIQAVRPQDRAVPPAGVPGVILGGKYRLEEAIARGGMARVWRATHVTLNRPVAVKFVDSFGTGEERIERFLREAKVAASVRHRHVVDILDFGTSRDGEPYMVMELLEGETLDERLMRGAIGDGELVDIVTQLLSGLDAVHRVGIVHRDLKPGNVFLTVDEVDGLFARLLDFGISQDADEIASDDRVVVGTPEYMSPEQAFGDLLDARSDIYSVGVVLYEILSGVLPFEHADPQQVVELVAHGTPLPIIELRPDAPEMCAVVERAMARDPADRFISAREMRRAVLEASGRGPETTGRHSAVPRDSHISGMQSRAAATAATEVAHRSEPPEAPARRSYGWIGFAVIALLITGGAVGWALTASMGGDTATEVATPDLAIEGHDAPSDLADPDPSAVLGADDPSTAPGSEEPSAAVGPEDPSTSAVLGHEEPSAALAPQEPSAALGDEEPSTALGDEEPSTVLGQEESLLGAGEAESETEPDTTAVDRRPRRRAPRAESPSPTIVRELDF